MRHSQLEPNVWKILHIMSTIWQKSHHKITNTIINVIPRNVQEYVIFINVKRHFEWNKSTLVNGTTNIL